MTRDFGKFLIGGIIWSLISIPLTWILIDYIGLYAFIASTLIVILGIITRYCLYSAVNLIERRFLKFASADMMFSLLNIALMTAAIDIMKIPTLIAAPLVIVGIFVLKFATYSKIKMIT